MSRVDLTQEERLATHRAFQNLAAAQDDLDTIDPRVVGINGYRNRIANLWKELSLYLVEHP